MMEFLTSTFTLLLLFEITLAAESKPVFSEPSGGATTASVPENSPPGTSVFDVSVSDPDNDAVTVTIESQPTGDNFKVEGTQLKVNDGASLDFESGTTSYQIQFQAEDADNNVVVSDTLTVTVSNVNEAPTFQTVTHNLEREAGVAPPQAIVIMGATDPDVGDTITYNIADGDPGSDFQINRDTGEIQTAKTLVYTSTPYDLRITATDNGGLVTTGTVVVTLKSAPVLTMPIANGVSEANIAENTDSSTDTGRQVAILASTDADGDGATYEIVQQSVADVFVVSGSNLVTNALLDYETEPYTYEVVIKVTDDSNLHLTSTGTLSISVTNVNEYSPVFNPNTYSKSLKEQNNLYTNFLQVTATDEDRGDTISYSISGNEGPFSIDSTSGFLSSSAAIVYSTNPSYTLTIIATDSGGQTGTASVDITVIEATNPVFTDPPSGGFTKTIPEDTGIDTSIYQIAASDADGDTLTLVMTQGSPEFSLDPDTGDVTVTAVLDFDTSPNIYEIIFEARDQNSATSSATLTVSLSDVNDNSPVFSNGPYSAKAIEGQTSSTQIIQVTATDADSSTGQNNVIRFEITDGNTDNKFSIDAATGWISASNLDYASMSSYTLEITASDKDGGANALTATTDVAVNVATAPVLTMPIANGVSQANIAENTASSTDTGRPVATLASTDADGDGATYEIVQQSVVGVFMVSGSNLVTNVVLDYETEPYTYEVVIKVTDDSTLQLTSTGTLSISVTNVNEYSPVFNQNTYSKSLKEQSDVYTDFLQVTATDEDRGDTISYSISGNAGPFSIDSTSGFLSSSAAIVYATESSYTLTIVATDSGEQTGTANVDITVIEATNPVFTDPPSGGFTKTIPEDTGIDTSIYQIAASDADGDTLTLVMTQGSPEFSLDPDTGDVTVTAVLDFDTSPNIYEIIFEARDQNSATSSATLTVSLSDVNDNSPVFSNGPYSAKAIEGQTSSTQIIQVTATDADSSTGQNNVIRFEITDGNTDNKFSIDAATGWISASNLDYASMSSYTLEITASDKDGGANALTATTDVAVNVATAPVLTMPIANGVSQANIAENTASSTDTGRPVATLASTDADGDGATYEIVQQSVVGVFMVSGSNLVTNVVLDYETEPYTYEVVIKVTDDSTLQLTSTGTLSISVTNVNEYSPVFNQNTYSKSLKEQSDVYTDFLQVTATDEDRGDTISYSISGNAGPFSIDSTSGFLSSSAAIVYATESSYTLTIVATDSGEQTGTANVDITVIEATNPVFTDPPSGGFTKTIPEDTGIDTSIYQIAASDADGDTLTLVMTQGSPEFSLDPDTGDVTVTAVLDFDTSPNIYEIIFEARDQNSATSSATLTVSLSDVNDNSPVFSNGPYSAKAIEGQTSSTQIIQVTATDADSSTGQNNVIRFEITDGNTDNKFSIDAATGWISASNLDYASMSSYTLEITASDKDGGANALTATTDVAVNVATAPVLTMPIANGVSQANIAENTASSTDTGRPVATLASTDADGDGATYEIVQQSVVGVFMVSGSNLVTNVVLDYETEPYTYEVVIKVTDDSTLQLTSTGTLSISVTNVNEYSPVFNQNTYSKSLKEQSDVYTDFLQVTATDEDRGDTISYSISGNAGPFSIDSTSGFLSSSAAIVYATESSYTLTIVATDSGEQTGTANVDITVIEATNPVFTDPPSGGFTKTIPEDTGIDTSIYQIAASDADGDTLTLVMTQGSPEFSLDPDTGDVTVTAVLDFDTSPNVYEIIFEARDQNSATSSATLTVSLSDVNDNPPVFSNGTYSAKPLEGQTSSTQIIQVAATDADSSTDQNNVIRFEITGGNTDNKFTIDAATGWISASNLDFATTSSYTLEITASDKDGGANALTATTNVAVSVATAPVLSDGTADLNENEAEGYIVYTLAATDADGDTVTYSITSQTPETPAANMFVIEGAQIKTGSTSFDADAPGATTSYTLTIRASDGTYNDDANIVITVVAVDDEPPVFNPSSYTKTIPETAATGTSVVTVTATDLDSEDSSLQFSITGGNDGNAFTMVGGQINTAGTLDYDTKSTYTLTVQASDGTNTGDTTVTVNLNKAPTWEAPAAANTGVDMNEDVVAGSIVYTLSATDVESETVTYSITSQTPASPADLFVIEGNKIKTGSIDFDADADGALTSIILAVRAQDGAGNTVDSSIVITVVDVNDEDPVFDPTTYSANLWEGVAAGTSVTTVTASDADNGTDFNTLSFSITEGNDESLFTMSGTQINVAGALSFDSSPYSLKVQASDGSRTATATATISLYTKPKWVAPPQNAPANIDENVGTGVLVYTLEATDADGGAVTYSLLSQSPSTPNANMFSLEGNLIKTGSTPFDVDADGSVTSYTLSVRASSSGDDVDTSLVVEINGVDDEPPVFDPPTYTKPLWEGAEIGTSVLTVAATDVDTDSASLTYTITSGNTGNAFAFSGSQINVAAALDYGTKNSYSLIVRASDGMNHQDAPVTINLNTRPVFTSPPDSGLNKNIAENIPETYTIYTIAVSDEDGEAVTKTISGTKFILDGNDVKLAPGEELDFEITPGPFTISFVATDASGNAITSGDLVLTVTDVNDNTPTFSADLFSKTMKTTAAAGSTVMSVVATDADSSTDNNNQITYSINSGNTNGDFEISSGGEVTTVNSLTMSTPNYNLEIYAVDGGLPALTGSTTLTITVSEPSNPAFTTPPVGGASISVPENQAVDSIIYTLVATDADGDSLTYRIKTITPSSGSSKFSVSGDELRVATALDFESQATSYTLTFGADDDDGDSSNEVTSTSLTITITNVNEFTPAFTEAKYTKTTTEKFSSGDTVTTVTATDSDAGAQISYSITAGNSDGSFAITDEDGEITATKTWPADGDDASTEADLTVRATDGELSSTVVVEIRYNAATRASFAFSMLIFSFSLYLLFVVHV